MKPKKTEKLKTVFKTYQFWLKIQYTLSHKSFIGDSIILIKTLL
jgi:hypothetical protein